MRTQTKKTSGILLLLLLLFAVQGFAQLTITPTITQPCAPGTGSVTFSVSGGTGPFTYIMYDGNSGVTYGPQSSATFTGLSVGSYGIEVHNAIDSGYASFNITSVVSVHAWGLSSACGANSGSAGIYVVNGGTGPYTYHWSTGQSTQQIDSLPPGYYFVYVTDANGCRSDTSMALVNDSSSLAVTISNTGTVCNPVLTASDSGGTATLSYVWSNGSTSASISGLSSYRYYSVTATGPGGCTASNITYVGSVGILIDSADFRNPTCGPNGSIVAYPFSGTAPYSYHWSTGATTDSITGLPSGTYYVTVTDANGCTGIQSYFLHNTSGVTIYNYTNDPSCDSSNGWIYVAINSGTGPFTYSWNNNSNDHTQTDSGLVAGRYICTVTDGNGCSTNDTVLLTSAANFNITITQSQVICPADTGSLTVTASGAGPYTYLWSTGATAQTVTGVGSWQYISVTVSDGSGCQASMYDTLTVTSPVSVSFLDSACAGTLTAIATGGTAPYTYSWYDGRSGATVSTAPYSYYGVWVTDANGCSGYQSFSTGAPGLEIDSFSTVNFAACGYNDGSIIVQIDNGTAPYHYAWSSGTATDSLDNDLGQGVYTVTVTDGTGCSASQSFNVYSASLLYINLTNIVYPGCTSNNGAIAVSSNGAAPFTYLWSTGSTDSAVSGLAAGTYYVTVTDAHGCTGAEQINLSQSNLSTYSYILSYPSCGSANGSLYIYAYGGSGSYSYQWSNGSTYDSISGLTAGLYLVTVTDQNTGCSVIVSDTLTNASSFYINVDTLNNPTCGVADGLLSVYAYGGSGSYSYLWSTGATSRNLDNLPAGTYAVTATDLNGGCIATATYTLSGVAGFTVSIVVTPTACDSTLATGTATAYITGTGTAPYSFAWYANFSGSLIGTTQTITGLPSEYVNVVVTDANGCSPPYYSYDSIPLDPSCFDNIIGQVFIDSNGNCIPDPGEQGLTGAYVQALGNNGQVYYACIDSSGLYDIQVVPGIYQVTVYYYNYGYCGSTLCVSSYIDTFTAPGQISTGNNFAIDISSSFDLVVHPGCYSSTPGSQKEYWVYYYNQGTASAYNAVVTFTYDPSLTLLSTTPAYSSIDAATHTITWNVGTVVPTGFDWSQKLIMNFQVPATDSLGQILYAQAEITPISGDCDPSNNIINISDVVTGSHDPNYKEVSPAGDLSASDTVLTYTIGFENDGTSPANTVVIVDTLSSNVNPATVIPGASSAPYTFKMTGNGIMTFTFQGINLAIGSRGFVSYTVNTKHDLPLGAVVNNTASVYFDLNPAVVTNTTTNERANNPNGIGAIKSGMGVNVIPNPAHDQALIEFTGTTGAVALRITDALGNIIASSSVDNNVYTLDAQSLASGIYFYTAADAAGHKASGKISVVH